MKMYDEYDLVANTPFEFGLADNTQIQATKAQLKQALRLAGEEQTRLWT